MNHRILSICLLLSTGGTGLLPAEEAASFQGPPETFVLKLPKGQSITFSLIKVSEEENVFSSFRFAMGRALDAGYMARMAPTSVSGTVYIPAKDGEPGYWALPIANTELTRGQYAALATPDNMPGESEAKMPQTGISELQIREYLALLNEWCRTDKAAKKALAGLGERGRQGAPFVRLLQESEWEFAARGAGYVTKELFEADHPYADKEELQHSEVLFSPGAAKIRAVGSTGKTNPCGLYDMLGNAGEMVEGAFRPEYHFGRMGGMLVRGGSVLTKPSEASSYLRKECPHYTSAGKPYSHMNIGCRLALGSDIITVSLASSLDDDWDEYVNNRVSINPQSSTTDSLEEKLSQEREGLALQLREISSQMASFTGKGNTEELSKLEDYFKAIKTQLSAMENQARQSYETTAKAGLQMIYYSASSATEDGVLAQRAYDASLRISDPAGRERLARQAEARLGNLETYWDSFVQGSKSLAVVDRQVLRSQVEARRESIRKNPDPAKRAQLPIFDCSVRYVEKYINSGVLTQDDFQAWSRELIAIGNDIASQE